jgi:acyl-CoA thioesterase-1
MMRILYPIAFWCAVAFAQNSPTAVPRVLIIGDSISIGYTPHVQKLMEGKADVRRIEGNGGPSSNGMFLIDAWLGKEKWDVIHFNFGLHDLKRLDDGKHQVPLEAYERYLRLIVQRMKKTGARLIWASTTPVPEGNVSPPRVPADVPMYNAAAARVMKDHGVPINDLYSFALSRLNELQRPVNVHFTDAGSAVLAAEVARALAGDTLYRPPRPARR